MGAAAATRRGRGRGRGRGGGGDEGVGAAARRRVYGCESERVREKGGNQRYLHALCRAPVIWHSAKIFLFLKYALLSARSGTLDKVVFAAAKIILQFFAECHPTDTWQSTFVFFLFWPPNFLWCVPTLCRPTCTILGQL
jgi:hypothetical protein